jgi:glycosyltransferase involved in cell wall biosynthesis
VPPGDVHGLAAAVRALLDDPAALAAARSGAERAREELTWEIAARSHLELYRELV